MEVLIVPTYNYLCEPILGQVLEVYGRDADYHWIELKEPRANYGSIDFPQLPIKSRYILHSSSFNGIENEMQKKALFVHLNEINPSVIITFSDATVFARFIKNTKYEERVMVIQPCLLDLTKISVKSHILYFARKIVNKLIARGGLKDQQKLGGTLRRACFFVWSDIERKFFENKGLKVVVSGTKLASFPKKKGLSVSDEVLVVAPDFNFYESAKMVEEYFFSLQTIADYFNEYKFKIKYHPLNKVKVVKMGTVESIDMLDNETIEKAVFIISGISNLVITSSFLNQNIFILDVKKYENPYITRENFFHFNISNINESCISLVNKFNSNTDFNSMFTPDDDFEEWLKCQ